MIGPPQDPNEKCAYCGHTHAQHELGECGCQLECTMCTCTDFTYQLDWPGWTRMTPTTPKEDAHRVARDMTLSTDWPE